MKKIILVFLVGLTASCELYNFVEDQYLENRLHGHNLFFGDFGGIDGVQDAADYVRENIRYELDENKIVENPSEVINRGFGDCDERCLVFLNVLFVSTGIKGNVVAVDSREIVNGGFVNHGLVEVDGVVYSAFTGEEQNTTIGYRYYFNDLFF